MAVRIFTFKFQTNQPLTYAISIKSKTVSDNNIAGKTSLQSITQEIRYYARLTALRKGTNGTMWVSFKPNHLEEDLDNTGLSKIVTQIRDLKIKSWQNNIITIDTENNVGMGQANQLKVSVYPELLSGNFAFDPTGRIMKFQGDLPFSDHWNNVLKNRLGFFCFLFPNRPVGIRESWTQSFSMNSSGGATLDNPLIITNTFTRQQDLMTNGNTIATFEMTGADHLRNISGHFEQNGQKSGLNISQFDHDAFGTYHFDQKRGVLLDADSTDTGELTMNMLAQGNTATSQANITTEIRMSLITDPIEQSQKQP